MSLERRIPQSQDLRDWLAEFERRRRPSDCRGRRSRARDRRDRRHFHAQDGARPRFCSRTFRATARATASSPIFSPRSRRIAMTLGLPPSTTEVELVRFSRDYMREAADHPSGGVNTGAVFENVLRARRSIS